MIQITHKSNSLRKAIAEATVRVSMESTVVAVKQKLVPKGDVLEFARVAGLFAVKRTSDLIPDCHPLPVEYTQISYELLALEIKIKVEVHTIYKTGVEVEAMHGASVVALTLYDMLKPIDKGIEISSIRLVSKFGGKSDAEKFALMEIAKSCTARIVVCSDSLWQGKGQDVSGEGVKRRLESMGLLVDDVVVVADEVDAIQAQVISGADGFNLLVFVGGTGLSFRDVTPEAVRPLLTREIEGVMEVARAYGQERMPFAMLSRGVAGMFNNTLVLTLPGSSKGALETIDAIFPAVLHVFSVKDGQKH